MMELAQYQARSMVLGAGGGLHRLTVLSPLSALSLTSGGVTAGAEALGSSQGARGLGREVPAPYCRGQGFSGCDGSEHLTLRGLRATDRTLWEGQPGAWGVRGLSMQVEGKELQLLFF